MLAVGHHWCSVCRITTQIVAGLSAPMLWYLDVKCVLTQPSTYRTTLLLVHTKVLHYWYSILGGVQSILYSTINTNYGGMEGSTDNNWY
jgi:hypothetical protein